MTRERIVAGHGFPDHADLGVRGREDDPQSVESDACLRPSGGSDDGRARVARDRHAHQGRVAHEGRSRLAGSDLLGRQDRQPLACHAPNVRVGIVSHARQGLQATGVSDAQQGARRARADPGSAITCGRFQGRHDRLAHGRQGPGGVSCRAVARPAGVVEHVDQGGGDALACGPVLAHDGVGGDAVEGLHRRPPGLLAEGVEVDQNIPQGVR